MGPVVSAAPQALPTHITQNNTVENQGQQRRSLLLECSSLGCFLLIISKKSPYNFYSVWINKWKLELMALWSSGWCLQWLVIFCFPLPACQALLAVQSVSCRKSSKTKKSEDIRRSHLRISLDRTFMPLGFILTKDSFYVKNIVIKFHTEKTQYYCLSKMRNMLSSPFLVGENTTFAGFHA